MKQPSASQSVSDDQLTAGLGWFSLGLGTAQLLAPRAVNWLAGIERRPRNQLLQRAVGVRELGAAAGIFSDPNPYPWVWARVAGDAMDLTMLTAALMNNKNKRFRVLLATASVVAVTAADVVAGVRLARDAGRLNEDGALRGRTSITIRRDAEEVYRFWRDFENLPSFMYHVESVKVNGDGRSHWVAKGPADIRVEWDAEVTLEVPNEMIAWRSVPGSGVENSGVVWFRRAPRDQGTEVAVEIEYKPPAGPLGAAVAKLFGEEPVQQMKDDLRRFKQVVETGEVVRSEGTPEGTLTRRLLLQREAQPPA